MTTFAAKKYLNMNDDFDELDSSEEAEIIGRFEKAMAYGGSSFFDVEEFEVIINYYLDEGDLDNVKAALSMALGQHPGSVTFLLKEAQLYASDNNSEKALALLDKLETLEPANAEIHMTRGAIYSKLNKHLRAIDEFRKSLPLSDNPDDILTNIAIEYERLEDYDSAIKNLLKAIDKNPENEDAINELAVCFEQTGKNQMALDFFTDYVDKYPYSFDGWFNLGIAHSNLGDFENAIDSYDFAIAIQPDYPATYFNKGNALANMNKLEEAIESYNETFLYEPADPQTYYYIGECYEKMNKFDLALQYYQYALNLYPNMTEALVGMSLIHDNKGNSLKSMEYMAKVIEIEPENAEYNFFYADLLRKNEKLEGSIEYYVRAKDLDNENWLVYIDIAETLELLNRHQEAIGILHEGMEAFPANASIAFNLSLAYNREGKSNEALSWFHLAVHFDPTLIKSFVETISDSEADSEFINLMVNQYMGKISEIPGENVSSGLN